MAHRPNECAARQEIAQAVSLTKAMDLIKDTHLNLAQFLNIFNLSHCVKG
jgi:hypothetical protein